MGLANEPVNTFVAALGKAAVLVEGTAACFGTDVAHLRLLIQIFADLVVSERYCSPCISPKNKPKS